VNIVQITPGAGGMYCGGCFRDNILVAALRKAGHETLMVPLYLPLTLDEPDQSAGTPIFFSGINVYLEQKFPLFRRLPNWMLKPFSSRTLLSWAGGRAAKTRPADVGDLAISMIRGEEGNQAREIDELIDWLKKHSPPQVICLSNVLLVGMVRRLKSAFNGRIVCLLSGEDSFLDSLPTSVREQAWRSVIERCNEIELFLSPTRYFADLMAQRLSLASKKMAVLPNGINLTGYRLNGPAARAAHHPPVLGYFARMCPEKGLDTLVDAYLLLKKRPPGEPLRLHVGGGCGPGDQAFVDEQRRKLESAGCLKDVAFFPNVSHAEKISFLQGLTLFSVPSRYNEAFGLYLLEAMAAGAAVVQPQWAAYPEVIQSTGGGLLYQPNNPAALADALESLLQDPVRAQKLGAAGQSAVFRDFSAERMAANFLQILQRPS
jgi:glycosyltransferase involved in cell wall biosynthesis